MAQVNLKISEEKYRDTLSKLGDLMDKLETQLGQLQAQRAKIEDNYKGPIADMGIAAVKENERKVQTAIDNVRAHREQIEKYLNDMDKQNTEFQGRYQEAKEMAGKLFQD